jgi:hypothetical protein
MVNRRQRQPDWKPATTFKVVRLKPNGPKPGQSMDQWLYGKEREQQEFDRLKDQKIDKGEL